MAKRFGVKFNPETTLKNLETTHIEVFLEWNILRSPKTKTGDCLRRSTVQFMYKNLQILYCLETETQLPRRINVLINGYIEQDLTAKHNLIAAGLDKPTCSVANLYHLPYFHWCQDVNTALHERYRVQVALKYPKEGGGLYGSLREKQLTQVVSTSCPMPSARMHPSKDSGPDSQCISNHPCDLP
ncbi:hypothetical protein EDC01DRAFT_20731 [Geopyxis carbonaria]|nr:hypothetical protein EDC01DRAFT_20731 [Geopyxis carbonaria]